MPVRVGEYPNCCSVYVLYGLGGDRVSVMKEIQAEIKRYHKQACAFSAITSLGQPEGMAALKALGFTSTPIISKAGVTSGTYNRVNIWHLELSNENVEAASKVKCE